MPVCIRCGANLADTCKYCGVCGYPVKQTPAYACSNMSRANNSSQQTKAPVCIRCGKQFGQNDKFCGECGYPINQKTQSYAPNDRQQVNNTTPRKWTKEETVAELDRMLAYFSSFQDLYDKRDTYSGIYYERLSERETRYNSYRYYDENPQWTLINSYSLLFTISFISLIAAALILALNILFRWEYAVLIAIGCFVLSGFCCYFGVVLLIKDNKHKRTSSKELTEYKTRIEAVYNELKRLYENYGHSIVELEYTNPVILRKIKENIQSGRADTLLEAQKTAMIDYRRGLRHR